MRLKRRNSLMDCNHCTITAHCQPSYAMEMHQPHLVTTYQIMDQLQAPLMMIMRVGLPVFFCVQTQRPIGALVRIRGKTLLSKSHINWPLQPMLFLVIFLLLKWS